MQIPEKEFAFFLCPLKNTPLALFWKYKLLSVRRNFIHSLLFSQFYADLIKIWFLMRQGKELMSVKVSHTFTCWYFVFAYPRSYLHLLEVLVYMINFSV